MSTPPAVDHYSTVSAQFLSVLIFLLLMVLTLWTIMNSFHTGPIYNSSHYGPVHSSAHTSSVFNWLISALILMFILTLFLLMRTLAPFIMVCLCACFIWHFKLHFFQKEINSNDHKLIEIMRLEKHWTLTLSMISFLNPRHLESYPSLTGLLQL